MTIFTSLHIGEYVYSKNNGMGARVIDVHPAITQNGTIISPEKVRVEYINGDTSGWLPSYDFERLTYARR